MAEYIEREILLQKNFYTENCNSEENRWNDYAIKDIIRHIPAADVAPVKHGHWIQVDKNKCECSNCGIIVLIAVYPHGDKNYCPNCGTEMNGDGSDG